MGRTSEVSIISRASEYKEHGFYVSENNTMLCKYCDSRVEWKRRDSCEKHIQSKGHKIRVEEAIKHGSTLKRQSTIESTLQAQKKARNEKNVFIMDTTEMFLKVSLYN